MRECLCRWQEAGDGRAIFLGCYALMTENMVAAVRAGEFRDPAWVQHLLVHFAGYYFSALDAWDADDASLPPVWRCAYEVACQPDASALHIDSRSKRQHFSGRSGSAPGFSCRSSAYNPNGLRTVYPTRKLTGTANRLTSRNFRNGGTASGTASH